MSELIDRLAVLTGQRDRDMLDVSLVGALRDVLGTVSVSIYRCIGEGGQERRLTRARLVGHGAAAEADPAWPSSKTCPAWPTTRPASPCCVKIA